MSNASGWVCDRVWRREMVSEDVLVMLGGRRSGWVGGGVGRSVVTIEGEDMEEERLPDLNGLALYCARNGSVAPATCSNDVFEYGGDGWRSRADSAARKRENSPLSSWFTVRRLGKGGAFSSGLLLLFLETPVNPFPVTLGDIPFLSAFPLLLFSTFQTLSCSSCSSAFFIAAAVLLAWRD